MWNEEKNTYWSRQDIESFNHLLSIIYVAMLPHLLHQFLLNSIELLIVSCLQQLSLLEIFQPEILEIILTSCLLIWTIETWHQVLQVYLLKGNFIHCEHFWLVIVWKFNRLIPLNLQNHHQSSFLMVFVEQIQSKPLIRRFLTHQILQQPTNR